MPIPPPARDDVLSLTAENLWKDDLPGWFHARAFPAQSQGLDLLNRLGVGHVLIDEGSPLFVPPGLPVLSGIDVPADLLPTSEPVVHVA